MKLPKFEYVQPPSLREARAVLEEHSGGAAILAGGTALIVDLRYRLRTPSAVVGMKGLSGLDYVRRRDDGGLAIGAMVTLETLENSPLLAGGYAPLAQAAHLIAVPSIRHVATIGGNLCLDTRCIYYNQSEFWRSARPACFKLGGKVCHAIAGGRRCLAVYQSDLAPILLALGAQLKIIGAHGEKLTPLLEFFTRNGEKPNVLEPDDILAEVQIPPLPGNTTGAYEKLRIRDGLDFPLAGAAVSVRTDASGIVEQARMVLGAVASSPVLVPEAAELLVGQSPTEDLLKSLAQEAYEHAHPVANLAIDAGYRRKMVRVLVKRALRRALGMA